MFFQIEPLCLLTLGDLQHSCCGRRRLVFPHALQHSVVLSSTCGVALHLQKTQVVPSLSSPICFFSLSPLSLFLYGSFLGLFLFFFFLQWSEQNCGVLLDLWI